MENKKNVDFCNVRNEAEQMLFNALEITDLAMDLKEKTLLEEKYVGHFKSLAMRSAKIISGMKNTNRSFLILAQRMVHNAVRIMEILPSGEMPFTGLKQEYEKLLTILDKELSNLDEHDEFYQQETSSHMNVSTLTEKLRNLEAKQKTSDCNITACGTSRRPWEDEKYPESCSKESLIDLNAVVNLPPVPENIFSGFSLVRPVKSSSLSSLKNLRKVKMSLNRVSPDEEDDNLFAQEFEENQSNENFAGKKPINLEHIKEES